MRRAVLLAVLLAALVPGIARADQVSRSREAFDQNNAAACRLVLGTDDATCNVDGYDLSEANILEYESSWTHRALAVQRSLDDDVPIRDALWPHTHNSFNSEAYTPTVSRLDRNQLLSITDQLRLDMRAIEIDIHRSVSVTDGRVGVVACHAQDAGGTIVHPGCTTEESLRPLLEELRAWLDANPTQLVLLYLENNLDGDAAAHAEAVSMIEETLGDLVHRPAGDACTALPLEKSRRDIRFGGKQVLLTGNCGPSGWNGWVFERGPDWDESSNPAGDDYRCRDERGDHDYDREMTRRYEDRTWLTAMVGGEGGITRDEMLAMVTCGVNLVGFDMLHPDDPRLETLIWSWAEPTEEPSAPGCALQGTDGRWSTRPCEELHRAACFVDGAWSVSTDPVAWAEADDACAFARPWNGWENQELLTVGGGDVWVRWSSAA
jgi:hypothetical protein